MIQYEALFNITYGLYIVTSGSKEKPAGFIANAAFQVTSEPPQFAVCCNKSNYSADIIRQSGFFGLSVLHKDASAELIGTFGYKSGKTTDKFSQVAVNYAGTGTPLVIQDVIATLLFKLKQTIDAGTHYIFIGELIATDIIDASAEPLTYAYYRKIKKGKAPVNAPTYIDESKLGNITPQNEPVQKNGQQYKCDVCGYVYAEDYAGAFDELGPNWVCPVCGVTKNDFTKI